MTTAETIDTLIKIFGILGALLALFLTWRTHAERATFDMIDKLYALHSELQSQMMLGNWRLGHLFCITVPEYEATKRLIARRSEPDQREEWLVKERLFAIQIFVVYEQAYYQWAHSSRLLHRSRRRFLFEMLDYFTERLMLNPRLLHFLQSDATGASLHLEGPSREYIDSHLKGKQGLIVDAEGPFGASA